MLSESFAPKKRFFNTVIIIAACLGHADFDLVQDKFSVRIITIQVAQNSKNGLLAKVRVTALNQTISTRLLRNRNMELGCW